MFRAFALMAADWFDFGASAGLNRGMRALPEHSAAIGLLRHVCYGVSPIWGFSARVFGG